jgi:hypothetical protein
MLIFLVIVGLVCVMMGTHFPFNFCAGAVLVYMLYKATK